MARTEEQKTFAELKGNERIFRIDRDTTLVYTGKEKGDMRPFVRVGAGRSAPFGLLKHIDYVVVPEKEIWNLGLEMSWLGATVQESGEAVRYVGSKDRVGQIQQFSLPEGYVPGGKNEQQRVNPKPYTSASNMSNQKERSLVTYLADGNFILQVNGNRTLDYEGHKRTRIHVDKEYESLSKILGKMSVKCTKGFGFVFLGQTSDQDLPIFWNFQGIGLLQNPFLDYHQTCFDMGIDFNTLGMTIASSCSEPGLVEILRRKSVVSGPIGIYSPEQEKVNLLKKIFSGAKVMPFDDARSLPANKNAVFFVSKGRSYGVFSLKMAEKTEVQIQILFPLADLKPGKSFDYIHGPYDLEIALVDSPAQMKKLNDARMTLFSPSQSFSSKKYLNAGISPMSYPLVPGKEVHYHYTEQSSVAIDVVLSSVAETEYAEPLKKVMIFTMGVDFDEDALRALFSSFLAGKVPADVLLRNNIAEAFRFMSTLSGYEKYYTPLLRKLLETLIKRYSLKGVKVKTWLELQKRNIDFTILFVGGKFTFLFGKESPVKESDFKIAFPPLIEQIEANQGVDQYRAYMKDINRAMDRMTTTPQALRPTVEFMEKLFEERTQIAGERNRLMTLLAALGIELGKPAKVKRKSFSMPKFLPTGLQLFLSRVGAFFGKGIAKSAPVIQKVRDSKALIWLIPLLALLGLSFVGFSAMKGYDVAWGDRAQNSSQTLRKEKTSPQTESPVHNRDSSEVGKDGNDKNVTANSNGSGTNFFFS